TVEHGVAGAPSASRFHGVTRKRSPSLTAFSSYYETLPLLRDQPATFSSDAREPCGPTAAAAVLFGARHPLTRNHHEASTHSGRGRRVRIGGHAQPCPRPGPSARPPPAAHRDQQRQDRRHQSRRPTADRFWRPWLDSCCAVHV